MLIQVPVFRLWRVRRVGNWFLFHYLALISPRYPSIWPRRQACSNEKWPLLLCMTHMRQFPLADPYQHLFSIIFIIVSQTFKNDRGINCLPLSTGAESEATTGLCSLIPSWSIGWEGSLICSTWLDLSDFWLGETLVPLFYTILPASHTQMSRDKALGLDGFTIAFFKIAKETGSDLFQYNKHKPAR